MVIATCIHVQCSELAVINLFIIIIQLTFMQLSENFVDTFQRNGEEVS